MPMPYGSSWDLLDVVRSMPSLRSLPFVIPRATGVSLEGTSLRPDGDASAEIYGRKVTARQIVRGTTNAVPDADRRLVDVLQKKAARNASTATR